MKEMSLDDLNLVKACEQTFEFEYIEPSGKGSGVFLEIIGAQADKVQKWRNNRINQQRQAEALNAKRKRDPEVRNIEDDIDFGIEYISIRIIGWKGISTPFTPENALKLCSINPEILDQVARHSENMANFTKSK